MQTSGNPSGINPTLVNLLYNTTPEELMQINVLTKNWTDEKIQQFVMIYIVKRKDEQTVLLTCLLGFVLIAGIHQFLLGRIGMGILYIFTGGLCLIGTVVDAINHKQLALNYNQQMMGETMHMMGMVR